MDNKNYHRDISSNVISELEKISYSFGYSNSYNSSFIFLYLVTLFRNRGLDQKSLFEISESYNMKQNIIDYCESHTPDDLLQSHFKDTITLVPEKMIARITLLISKVDFWLLNDDFALFFDNILNWAISKNRLSAGDARQPKELLRFILKLSGLPQFGKVYNPFAGLASLGTMLNEEQSYFGQEINIDYWALGKLRLMAYDKRNFHFVNDDSIRYWDNSNNYDLIFAFPPLNASRVVHPDEIRHHSFNWQIIEEGLNNLNPNGKMICIFPVSFLFASGSKDKKLRRFLVDNNLLETIVLLPGRILSYSAIQLCVVVLSKATVFSNKIRFIDASLAVKPKTGSKNETLDDARLWDNISIDNPEFVKYIDKQDIAEEDYNLSVSRYFVEEDLYGIRLSEFISPIEEGNTMSSRKLMQMTGRTLRINKHNDTSTFRIVRIKDLKNDIFNYGLETESLNNEIPSTGVFRKITESCLLVSSRYNSLKPTYFAFEGIPVYIPSEIYAFRVDKNICDVNFLIYLLHSDSVKSQISGYSTGSFIPKISKRDFLNLKVVLPNLEEQEKIYVELAHKKLEEKSNELGIALKDQITNVNDENSFLRHEIAGSLKNVRSSFRLVQKILKEKVADQVKDLYRLRANDILETDLETYLKIIERDLESINKSVNKMGAKIELSDMTFEKVDLLKFIQEYAVSLKVRAGSLYEVSTELDLDTVFESEIDTVYVMADKDILKKAFDNVVENSVKHAFVHEATNLNKIKIEVMYDFEDMSVQVDICNTGKPLPENISYDALVRKGSSFGKNGGEGTGLWYVREVMKLHGGEFGFTDETGREGIEGEFVTSMELSFPIIQE